MIGSLVVIFDFLFVFCILNIVEWFSVCVVNLYVLGIVFFLVVKEIFMNEFVVCDYFVLLW